MLFPNVKQIVSEFLPSWNVSRSVDLRDSCQSRNNPVPLEIPRDLLDRNRFSGVAYLYLVRHKSARTHEAHITAEDVPKLGQFVHCSRTQDATDFRNTGIVRRRLLWPEFLVCIGNHRSKLPVPKIFAAFTDTRLGIENRSTVLQLDRYCDKQPKRRRADNPGARQPDIEKTFRYGHRLRFNGPWSHAGADLCLTRCDHIDAPRVGISELRCNLLPFAPENIPVKRSVARFDHISRPSRAVYQGTRSRRLWSPDLLVSH